MSSSQYIESSGNLSPCFAWNEARFWKETDAYRKNIRCIRGDMSIYESG